MGHEARRGARMGGAVLACQTDERLLVLARGGHEAAFEALVRRHRRALVGYARRMVGDDRCEDVVQTALLKAYAALPGTGRPVAVRAWLYRIVHNTAIDVLRAHARTTTQLDETLPGGEEPGEALDRRERLKEAVDRLGALPARQRDAIVLQELHGRSQQEIAVLFSTSEGAVRQLVHRARAGLRSAAAVVLPLPFVASLARPGRAEAFASRLPDLIQGAAAAAPAGTGVGMAAKAAIATMAVAGATGAGAVAVTGAAPVVAATAPPSGVVAGPDVSKAPADTASHSGDATGERAARERKPSRARHGAERRARDDDPAGDSPEARTERRPVAPAPGAEAPPRDGRPGGGAGNGAKRPVPSSGDDARDEAGEDAWDDADDDDVPDKDRPDDAESPGHEAEDDPSEERDVPHEDADED